MILERVPPRVHAIAIAILLAGVVADGWAVPIPIVAYNPRGRLEDRAIAEWLRGRPPGVGSSSFRNASVKFTSGLIKPRCA